MTLDFIHSDMFLWGILCISAILLILYIVNSIKLSKLRKNYKDFMLKLGKGNDIEESLKTYIDRVEKVERKRIIDTDKGQELMLQISDLEKLLEAYKNGTLAELQPRAK